MIAFVHGAAAFGAVERYVLQLVEGLRDADEEIAIVFPDVPVLAPFVAAGGGNVTAAPFPAALLELPAPQRVAALARRLRALRPRVAHVTDVWAEGLLAARLARPQRLLVTHHTPELPRHDNAAGRLLWRLAWLARPEVIYTSESDRATDGRRGLRTHVIPLGIDIERFRRGEPLVTCDGPLVGTVGRLAEQKGQRYLLEGAPLVLARRPDARFALFGDGELRTELETLARSLGIADHVLFAGSVDDVAGALASLDVFVQPSLFEGLCLAVLEAQAAGVPVVATPVGGVRETVVDGETGLVVPARDAQAIATAVLALLDDPRRAGLLADEAGQRVLRYSTERMVDATLAVYGRQGGGQRRAS